MNFLGLKILINKKILLNQLELFSSNSIFYCIWKNVENYQETKNPYDLDIYIAPNHSQKAFDLLEENGWLRLINPVAEYRGIRHYYFFTSNKIFHLHIYSGLRTGDSWLKNYYLPLDEYILNNYLKDNNNINLLNNEAFHLIFSIRLLIKNSTLIGRLLYKFNILKYKKESRLIDYEEINLENIKNLREEFKKFAYHIKDLNIKFDNIPNIFISRRIINHLKKYSLINLKTNFLRQLISFLIRLINKFIFRFNKVLFVKAKIISFYGCDGSGKSTIVQNLVQTYKPYFPCSQAHLGKPFQGNNFFKKIYLKRNRLINFEKVKIKQFTILKGMRVLSLSLLRLISAYYQVLKTYLGITVITDRWPSEFENAIDGPIIFSDEQNNMIIYVFNFFNRLIYKFIPSSDFAIILETELGKVIERNSNRNKPEDIKFIKLRYDLHKISKPKSKKFIFYKNDENLDKSLNDCLLNVAKFLNN